jgi:hypothetical protein
LRPTSPGCRGEQVSAADRPALALPGAAGSPRHRRRASARLAPLLSPGGTRQSSPFRLAARPAAQRKASASARQKCGARHCGPPPPLPALGRGRCRRGPKGWALMAGPYHAGFAPAAHLQPDVRVALTFPMLIAMVQRAKHRKLELKAQKSRSGRKQRIKERFCQ